MKLSRTRCERKPETTTCRSVSTTDQPGMSSAATRHGTVGALAHRSLELSSRSSHWRTHQRGASTGRSSRKTTAGQRSISTPRGRNSFTFTLSSMPSTPGWFAERLTVNETVALSPSALAETRRNTSRYTARISGRAMFEQEMFCSFNASILGAFYALEMRAGARRRSHHRCGDRSLRSTCALRLGSRRRRRHDRSGYYQAQGAQLVMLDHYASTASASSTTQR